MYHKIVGGYIVEWKISLISDLSIPLGLSSLQLALTLQLAPSTAAVRVTGDQKLHGHLQCAKEHDGDERPVVGVEQRPAAEEHGAGHPGECEQQRRDYFGGLLDGRTDRRAAGEWRKSKYSFLPPRSSCQRWNHALNRRSL